MTTSATDKLPEIWWEQDYFVESHDHEKHYRANGFSKDNREWIGIWIEIDNNEVDIEDIEEK